MAREALSQLGFDSTLDYLAYTAEAVYKNTGLLPHFNPGCLTYDELIRFRNISPSMGIMLESTSLRLCEKGMPHYGSPDKMPEVRLATLEAAGKAKIPFTTGILIGIGETRRERIESLLSIRSLHEQYGHIQEIIIQNFRAKPDTKMAHAPEPDLNDLLWTLAIARLIFGPNMSIQAPPNLSPGVLPQLVNAGINDWGGVSPLTPDFVNPEAPWPHLNNLKEETEKAGKFLQERLTVYPQYVQQHPIWISNTFHCSINKAVDTDGFPRTDNWQTGSSQLLPAGDLFRITSPSIGKTETATIHVLLKRIAQQEVLTENDIIMLFRARGDDFNLVCQAADRLREQLVGDRVTYTVNRNINYTNVCYYKCKFCAFSKGKAHEALRGKPYDLSLAEIQRRVIEAWQRGATEVCMQGGIHPDYTGEHYLEICRAIKTVCPDMHIHAFSPLEIWQGAHTLGVTVDEFLKQLKAAGLATLPGTAAEILDDDIRAVLCADKINTEQWFSVMRSAHRQGLKTTATIMFGHLEHYKHWARHLLKVLSLQKETGGFTEFVPLPFVATEAPVYLRGTARQGPTFRESVLMHAVARLVLSPHIANIQTSWVKLGNAGITACLNAGANDLGGTLMNESITKAAGAMHGQENAPSSLEAIITRAGKKPQQRTTLYGKVSADHYERSLNPEPLLPINNTAVKPSNRKGRDKIKQPKNITVKSTSSNVK